MTAKKTPEVEKPALETDTYRIWNGRSLGRKEKRRLRALTMSIRPGERVHEVVVLSPAPRVTVKVLSKERLRDGRISCIVRVEGADGGTEVLRCSEWITRKQYDAMVALLKEGLDSGQVSVVPGEDIHVGLTQVLDRFGKEGGPKGKEEGEPPDSQASGPVKKRGGDPHGS